MGEDILLNTEAKRQAVMKEEFTEAQRLKEEIEDMKNKMTSEEAAWSEQNAKEAAKYGLVDFVGTPEAAMAELMRLWGIFKQIPSQLMRICKEELPAPSLDAAMLTMGSLDTRGRQRDGDEGTYVRLSLDDLVGVARLELHDPQHFNSFSFAFVSLSRYRLFALCSICCLLFSLFLICGL